MTFMELLILAAIMIVPALLVYAALLIWERVGQGR
jgi:hypothetical protein